MKKITLMLGLLVAMLLPLLAMNTTAVADPVPPTSEVEGVTLEDEGVTITQIAARTADASPTWRGEQCWRTTKGGDTIRTCVKVGWRRQDDGFGIAFEDVWITTTEGCGYLDGDIYRNVIPKMYKHDEHTFMKGGDWESDPCNYHHDFAWRGEEGGATDFRLQLTYDFECYLCAPYTIVWRAWFGMYGTSDREAFRTEQ